LATPAAAQTGKDPLEETTLITLGERTVIVKKLDTLLCVENDYTLLVAMRERNRSVGVPSETGLVTRREVVTRDRESFGTNIRGRVRLLMARSLI
jgi:hypothetical protein